MKEDLNATTKEYVKRINIVLDFIEKNLAADLSLESLAKKALYSPFHFHRVFSTVIGENLNQYVNRKRIERIASILLRGSNKQIKDLAYFYGFKSESSFSRTFKKFYGISPTKFKTEGKDTLSKIGIVHFDTDQYICDIDNLKKWIEMNAQIVVTELQEIQLAGIMNIGDFENIGGNYQRLMEWGHKNETLDITNFKAITIYHDNPNVTESSKIRSSACVTTNKHIEPEGEIRPLSIRKGIYVVGRFEIRGEDIAKAWKSICVWVIENGYEFRDGDYFEIYHNDHRNHPENKFILDICVPLEKTDNIKLNKTYGVNLKSIKKEDKLQREQLSYHELILYMKELRSIFDKEYETHFKLGKVYQGSPDFSYFSLTTEKMKKQKLKFVIILNRKHMNFSICLSGQNKSIRKKYWEMFRDSDWDKYHLVESIDNSLPIIDHIIINNPDFDNREYLTEQIETASLKFISDLRDILD